jgi:hypothetical protein
MKRLVRKPNYPLQQMILRLRERAIVTESSKPTNTNPVLRKPHHRGPLPSSGHATVVCYKQAWDKNFMISVITPNNCVKINGKISLVQNIFRSEKGRFGLYKVFKQCSDFFYYPLPSSVLGIISVDDLSNELHVASLSEISMKYVLISFRDQRVVFPLIHL